MKETLARSLRRSLGDCGNLGPLGLIPGAFSFGGTKRSSIVCFPTKTAPNPAFCWLHLYLVFAALVTILGSATQAHHILGLPHYSYKENYPQVPTLEYPAQSGPYEILMTCYPGKPSPGEAANLAIYIKNQASGLPYNHPIGVRVLQTFTFGRNRDVRPASTVPFYEQPHEVSVVFPDDGEYIVELTMDVEGQEEVIPFLMVAGEPSATWSVLIAIALFLLVFFVIIRALRIKRRRRMAGQGQSS
jgi:hypothetical protein